MNVVKLVTLHFYENPQQLQKQISEHYSTKNKQKKKISILLFTFVLYTQKERE